MNKVKTVWRSAASLIVAAPKNGLNSFDYNLMCMKRTSRSSFLPNAYVFPGGGVDDADKSPKWFDIFKSFDPLFVSRIPEDFFIKQNDSMRSPLFPGDIKSLNQGVLPNEISYRICAIRESFEESGVLLVTDALDIQQQNPLEICAISRDYLLDRVAMKKWRSKVHKNASEFLNLCLELRCVPNVWSLKEWSHWLTPIMPNHDNAKRYDTVFYSCCMKKAPQNMSYDESEMEELVWLSPEELLRMYIEKKTYMRSPQLIELSRLMNFRSINSLNEFMTERAMKGTRSMMGMVHVTNDGKQLLVLPGDDLHPDHVDVELAQRDNFLIDATYDQIKSSKNQFRVIYGKTFSLRCNVPQDYGQIAPLQFPESITDAS